MTQLNFDARQVAPDTGALDPVPAGWYNVMIDQSEKKPTNDGQGEYLELRYNVLDGQHAGRKLFGRHNIRNASAQAQEIAWKQLSAVCHAVQMLVVQDSQQLHGIPLKIKVSLRAARTDNETGKTYDASNDIKAWKNINEPTEAAPPGAAPAPAGGVPAGFGAPAGFAPQQAPAAPPAAWGAPAAAPAAWQPAQPPAAPPQYQQPQPPAAQPPAAQPWQGGAPAGVQQPWQGGPPAVAQPPAAPAPVAQPWAPQGGAPGAPATPPWQQPR